MEFKTDNINVYGLDDSIIASGYPMVTNVEESELSYDRAYKLANTPTGTGHSNYLKGINVQFDVTAPQYWWLQAERYHWFDIVSSQSKMHRITKMDIKEQCNKYVDDRIITIIKNLINLYNEPQPKKQKDWLFQQIISNCPMGLMLTARITTNYLQLKTMHLQRKTHKLEEWSEFCNWLETLPYSELITNSK